MALIALLSACQRDYRFHTVAVYEAPRGQYSVRLDCQGMVRAGHDFSQESSGLLTVSPSTESRRTDLAPVAVQIALREGRVRFGDATLIEGASPESGRQVLSRLLTNRGYTVYGDELEELVSATEGALAGPKGTLMSGQSRRLRVVSTTFDRRL